MLHGFICLIVLVHILNVALYSVAHIEVQKLPQTRAEVMYDMLVNRFGDILGHKQLTPFEQSYDKHKKLFRFDLSPPGR